MTGVLTGFGVIAFVIFVGWLLAALKVVRGEDRIVLNKVAFFAASPALLFTVLARADIGVIFTGSLATHAVAVLVVGLGSAALMWLFGSRDAGRLVIGAHSAVYSNANNIGLPVAVYVIGDGQYVAPLLVLQLVVMAPLLMAVLDALRSGSVQLRRILAQPFVNPIVLGSGLGIVVSAAGWSVPAPVMLPLELLGGAAVPLMLIAFGISLRGQRPLQAGTGRKDVLVATTAKSFALPVVAWLLATYAFGLQPQEVYAATVLASLPTAQNMYQYALRYRVGEIVARDTILLTTILALPVTLLVAVLLHP
ncbi:AEC family transporter [Tessaracoccus oleiagri]|uniref:AEC family transporter n=1 Tax=Tessaracoccus oleiagri TaxID=686624 RepID=A0A1G9KJV1_9ACTN|nr:AEC family transporter [Tessaracoccus oleiagri]SDL49939.1 hypothetical protein SAMN04488242_1676 [Tessaracoccus oleiagri]